MKILTIHQPNPSGEEDFFGAVEGEIAVSGIVCDNCSNCGCDRSHGGLNSHGASTQLMVREVDLTLEDVSTACVAFLEDAGWASLLNEPGELEEFARGMADEVTEAAAPFAVGTVLRPLYDREREEWRYSAAVTVAGLPDDINQIIEHLAQWAKGYNNRLKWNEEAKLKSDMMEVPERWTPDRAPVDAVKAACLQAGMTEQDTGTIIGFLRKRQAGKRLVPQRSYKGFRFTPPVE